MGPTLACYFIFGTWAKGRPGSIQKMIVLGFSEKNVYNTALRYARIEYGEHLDETVLYHSVRAAFVEGMPTGEGRVIECRSMGDSERLRA